MVWISESVKEQRLPEPRGVEVLAKVAHNADVCIVCLVKCVCFASLKGSTIPAECFL